MKLVSFRLILASLLTTIVVIAPTAIEAKTFENDKYTFEFPSGCKLEKTENRFSSKDASLECTGDSGFSFESGIDTFASSTDDAMVTTLETVMENLYDNVNIVETGTDKYTINNMTAPYVIGTYDQSFSNAFGLSSTKPWVLMTIAIKLDSSNVILVQYRNSEDDFDKKLPMAEKIFQSVEPLAGSTSASSTALTSSSSDGSSNENKLAQMQTTIECGKILFDELGENDATIDVDKKSAVFANGTSMTCKDLEEIKK